MKCKTKERKITTNNNNDKKEIKKGKKGSKQIIFVAIKSIIHRIWMWKFSKTKWNMRNSNESKTKKRFDEECGVFGWKCP